MKTKGCFYVRTVFQAEIRAEAKNGYLERFGDNIYCYDKRGDNWYITDYRTGLGIRFFP